MRRGGRCKLGMIYIILPFGGRSYLLRAKLYWKFMIIGQVPSKQYCETAAKALAVSSSLTRPQPPSRAAVFGKESDKENSGNYLKHINVTVVTNC